MYERLLILTIILSGVFFLFRRFLISKPGKEINIHSDISGFDLNHSLPTILYFWTEQCVQCFSQQNPILSKLKRSYKDFNLISLNALNEENIVEKLNIKTVPSTAIILSNKVKFVNNGFAGEKLLLSQLKEVSG